MSKFKTMSQVCIVLATVLSYIIVAIVSYKYCALQWGGRYEGWSAPPYTAFIYAIPFVAGIVICVVLSWLLQKKS